MFSKKIQYWSSVIIIISEIILEKLATRTFNPSHSFLPFYKMKKNVECKNSNENITIKTNVGNYTNKIMFSTLIPKKEKATYNKIVFQLY